MSKSKLAKNLRALVLKGWSRIKLQDIMQLSEYHFKQLNHWFKRIMCQINIFNVNGYRSQMRSSRVSNVIVAQWEDEQTAVVPQALRDKTGWGLHLGSHAGNV